MPLTTPPHSVIFLGNHIPAPQAALVLQPARKRCELPPALPPPCVSGVAVSRETRETPSQQRTPPATQLTQQMRWGQSKAAVLPSKRLNVQLATCASCRYREKGRSTPLSHAHVPQADSGPLHHLLRLWPMHGPQLCYISQGTCIHTCIHVYALYTASTRNWNGTFPSFEHGCGV